MRRLVVADPATTEISPLSLHDALPIYGTLGSTLEHPPIGEVGQRIVEGLVLALGDLLAKLVDESSVLEPGGRSEEHTSELQSRLQLVCRLLLEKKKRIRLIRGKRIASR